MLVELFIFFQFVAIVIFITSFFMKQEILWSITLVLHGFLMVTSFDIEIYVYEYNASIIAYSPIVIHNSYPYLMGINMVFFSLALVLGLHDLFEKYGFKFLKKKG